MNTLQVCVLTKVTRLMMSYSQVPHFTALIYLPVQQMENMHLYQVSIHVQNKIKMYFVILYSFLDLVGLPFVLSTH